MRLIDWILLVGTLALLLMLACGPVIRRSRPVPTLTIEKRRAHGRG